MDCLQNMHAKVAWSHTNEYHLFLSLFQGRLAPHTHRPKRHVRPHKDCRNQNCEEFQSTSDLHTFILKNGSIQNLTSVPAVV
jgi:hypothetical protein